MAFSHGDPALALRRMDLSDREAEARRVLDVGPDASQDELSAAFKQASLRAHPAENPEDTNRRRRRSCIGGSARPTSA